MIDGVATKNAAPVVCSPYLSVPVRVDDEVTGSRNFALVSGICHSGTLTSGHYSAFVRDNVCGVWSEVEIRKNRIAGYFPGKRRRPFFHYIFEGGL